MRIADTILSLLPQIEGVEYSTMGHCVYAGTPNRCIEIALTQCVEEPSLARGLQITLRDKMAPVAEWTLNFDLQLDGKRRIGYEHGHKPLKSRPCFNINENQWKVKPNKSNLKDITTALTEYISFMYPFEYEEDVK